MLDPPRRRRLAAPVTAAQRLRLVLALGVVNLVLASVALGIGFVGIQSPPTTAGGPTPGIAFVSPQPTTPSTTEPTPVPSGQPGTFTPGTPVPTAQPPAEPSPTPPGPSPSVEPSPVEPTPSVESTPAATPPAIAFVPGSNPIRRPTVVVAQPAAPAPTPDSAGSPEAPVPVACPGKSGEAASNGSDIAAADKARTATCRNEKADKPQAAKPPKAKHHHAKKVHAVHRRHLSTHGHGQQAAVDKSNRGHKTARRLRIRRRRR